MLGLTGVALLAAGILVPVLAHMRRPELPTGRCHAPGLGWFLVDVAGAFAVVAGVALVRR